MDADEHELAKLREQGEDDADARDREDRYGFAYGDEIRYRVSRPTWFIPAGMVVKNGEETVVGPCFLEGPVSIEIEPKKTSDIPPDVARRQESFYRRMIGKITGS